MDTRHRIGLRTGRIQIAERLSMAIKPKPTPKNQTDDTSVNQDCAEKRQNDWVALI